MKERFARLGPVRAVDRVTSGTPAVFSIRLQSDHPDLKTIDAMFVLARRGLSMLKAKRQIEAVIERGQATVELPTVEDTSAVVADLDKAGFEAQLVQLSTTLDVRHVRQKLGLSREQFALRYGLEVEAVRNWETGKREPDTAARSYLRVISNAPEQVGLAYAQTPSP
ncbi:helix-turn-helix domain-containing protein (plasmid) [Lichenicola cladoniae]|uniref:Helix-turn-helix domain-containing protein n=2 Tax=Lichenicola cladoniae TaxID=1484109 RepID=A0A6M8HZN2_9PROT|nr:helix-turn-helix domain-containing protein [Acetobacteraceae bacterium]QKE94034.1 helix-turn-helix domain-containing protein [Lichenicola cladoniae]